MEHSILECFNLKDFIFYFIFWPMFNEIVENQELYKNKDDLKKKKSYFLILIFFVYDKYTYKMYIFTDI